jgi:transposase
LPVIQGSRDATVLVGMPGFVVGATEVVDGELWLRVETTADVVGCSGCGTRAVGHGRSTTVVRDLPISDRPVVVGVVAWWKRRWLCPDPDCDINTWTETSPEIAPRAVLTERARRRIARMVNVEGDSIAATAVAFGVGWHAANRAVTDYTDPETRRTVFTTQIVDLDTHRVLDVIKGRSRDVLGDWLDARGDDWCARIRLATLDPAAGYRRALELAVLDQPVVDLDADPSGSYLIYVLEDGSVHYVGVGGTTGDLASEGFVSASW